jgi:eukaryotic-like serine/threonine-protein kinase
MGVRLGQQIGNYRLVKLLGKGAFAEVYLGQHVHLASKQAAIKILHLIGVDERKFKEEAETTEKLVHPHIVRLLDFTIEQGEPFLVLDYASGGSLRARHPKGSIVPLASVGAYLKKLLLPCSMRTTSIFFIGTSNRIIYYSEEGENCCLQTLVLLR